MPGVSSPPFRYRVAVAVVLVAVLPLAGCTVAERQVARQGGLIDDLQERVLRLERSLEEAAVPAAAPAAPAEEQGGRRLADLGQQVEELAQQIRAVQGRIDALERKAGAGDSPVGSPRLAQLESELRVVTERVAALELRPAPGAAAPPPEARREMPPVAPSDRPAIAGQELYDQAYTLYKQGRFDDARALFERYAADNPTTKLTDNALFWVGESYYDEGNYTQAILEYDKVVQRFPSGDKVASALLKQAFAFDAIGAPQDAKILLRKLLREHPSSEQAGIARKKLEMLGQ